MGMLPQAAAGLLAFHSLFLITLIGESDLSDPLTMAVRSTAIAIPSLALLLFISREIYWIELDRDIPGNTLARTVFILSTVFSMIATSATIGSIISAFDKPAANSFSIGLILVLLGFALISWHSQRFRKRFSKKANGTDD